VAGPSHVRFYAGLPLAVSRDHLVGTLCVLDVKPRHLSEAEREALKDLATWVEKEMTVNDELERAAALQVGLLGAPEPELAGYKIAARCIPTGAVGGDFFDWYEPRRGAIAFSLGDVMGKGMPAAIMMATVRASLRAAARQASFASSVRFAAQAIHSDLARSDAFVTIFAGYLDGRSGGLRYVDAGHGLAMVRHADGTVELPTMRGLPFGIDPVERYTEGMLTLSPGDLLLVYSDGMMEALREPEPEDIARLAGADAGQAIRRLTAKAGTWSDDITLIAVSRDPEK
jgi:serine phosphatase RsbU (regulator of sigma subunit)